jgi:hypothetical protein
LEAGNGRPAGGKGKQPPMKNLPEGAGSPISRMPQTTEGGLQPTRFGIAEKNYLRLKEKQRYIV